MQEPRAGGGARLWQQRDTVQGVAQESQCRWTWCRGWRRRPAGAGHGVGGADAGAMGRRWHRSTAAAGHGARGCARVPVQLDRVQGVAQETCRSWTLCGGWQYRSHGQEVMQESGSSWTRCRGWRNSPTAGGHGAEGGTGDRAELYTVQGVAQESDRSWTWCRGWRRSLTGAGHGAEGGAGARAELYTVQGVAQEFDRSWTWCRGWRRSPQELDMVHMAAQEFSRSARVRLK